MPFDAIFGFLYKLSNSWMFVIGLFVVSLLLLGFDRTKKLAINLLFPAGLLLLRKILLYAPVSGSLSDLDHLVFWDTTSYIWYLVAGIVFTIGFITIRIGDDDWYYEDDYSSTLAFLTGVVGFFAIGAFGSFQTAFILLVLSFLYIPLIIFVVTGGLLVIYFILGIMKILIVSPVLLPFVWLYFLVLIVLNIQNISIGKSDFFAKIHKRFVLTIVFGGLVQFGFQGVDLFFLHENNSISNSITMKIKKSWRTDNPKFFEKKSGNIGAWWDKIPEINRSGVHLVEKRIPYEFQGKKIQNIFGKVHLKWDPVLSRFNITVFGWSLDSSRTKRAAVSAMAVFLLLFVFQKMKKDQKEMFFQHDYYNRLRFAKTGLLPRELLLTVCRDDTSKHVRLITWKQLEPELTFDEALYIIRSTHAEVLNQVIQSDRLSREHLFSLCKDGDKIARNAAWEQLYKKGYVTPEDCKMLSRSKYPDVRYYAVTCGKLPRFRLLEICKHDAQLKNSQAALANLQKKLSNNEVSQLSRSRHQVIRHRMAKSGRLSKKRLLWLAWMDLDKKVRNAAKKHYGIMRAVSNN